MYRQLYQMGGQGIMQLGNGQEEPIFPRLETLSQNLGQAEQTLGTPSNDQFNASSITTAITGRPQMNLGGRIGYQEGDMAMMQPEGIMGAMPPEAGGMQQGGGQEQTALLTIIQLLIEQGVPPEQAQELAMQILQVFAQGGQPAVEEFANQLEQEEMSSDRTMMAGGGITGIYPRQGFFVKGVVKAISGAVKGVASAVKSVAKSPIGMIALSIAAPYAIAGLGTLATGAGFTGLGSALSGFSTLGGSGFLGGALRAGLTNSLIQGITTGKINPKQALIAAIGGGAASGISQGFGSGQIGGVTPEGINIDSLTNDLSSGVVNQGASITPSLQPGAVGTQYGITPEGINLKAAYESPSITATGQPSAPTSFFDKATTSIQDFGTNLMKDPMGTIRTGIGSIYDKTTQAIKDYPLTAVGTSFLAGTQFRAPLPGEDPNEYNKLKAEHDAQVNQYYNLYSGYMNPPAFAANGGRIGFEYGSMPMGEPRKNQAGIMELDYRQKGGFVPPIGIKEKADDIPAMLSNNEFVFTADAVRNAGGGNVNKGAQRMYSLMKNLEAGGIV